MPFVSTKNNGGVPDPNVNRSGRPLKNDQKTITRREAKDKENLVTARKLKPIKHSALKHLQKIIDDPKTTEAGRLKAIDMIMKYSHMTIESLYAQAGREELSEDQLVVEEVQKDTRPIFSLRMVSDPDELNKEE